MDLGVTSAHYENDSIPMEAFARPLWGLVPFWMGGGREADFEDLYRRGFELFDKELADDLILYIIFNAFLIAENGVKILEMEGAR